MRLTSAHAEARLLDQLTTFLRQRVRDEVGSATGVGTEGRLAELRTLRQLQLGHAEARAHPERRTSVIARFRRLALRHREHPDFDAAWVIHSPDGVVSEALDLVARHEQVGLDTAASLLTEHAERHRTDLVEVAAQVVDRYRGTPVEEADEDSRPA